MEQNRKLTQEEMNILAKYTQQFESVTKSGYLRGATVTASKEISEILHGKPYRYSWNCPSCMIKLWTDVSKLYKYNIELQNEKPKRRTAKKKQKPKVESETGSSDID